ncbi:Protein of unknown function [Xaviernesmea oryzae]|uniref:Flagellar protein n=1 Tax=Xaviernesmea oryzae TaxID=464029 RepID=A0A1X7D9A1_9HYPH|nr:DUF1217 domain-containing protein [Xaviernesmea oryzae]SMF10994.1 Protein of unknown function [Xaviernesmea oryzae]
MVSTYLTFDLVNRDIAKSLGRVATQATVARDAEYYRQNIGKVRTIDEFVADYRLYSYAMTAYGLEEMIYAKAFIKKVLESDLSDANSYANRLTDDRYKNFAAAFNFGKTTSAQGIAQSEAQRDKLLGLYDQSISAFAEHTKEETRYYKAMVSQVKNVDQFLQNERLRNYMFESYGIDGKYFIYKDLRGALTSDLADPNSYYNLTWGNAATEAKATLAAAKSEDADLLERRNLDGSVTSLRATIASKETKIAALEAELADLRAQLEDGGDETELQELIDAKQEEMDALKENLETDRTNLESSQSRLDDLNARLVPLDRTDQRRAELKTLQTRLTAEITSNERFLALVEDFQFNADGSVPAGGAQTAEKLDKTVSAYLMKQPRLTQTQAEMIRDYAIQRLATATSIADLNLSQDKRLFDYIRSAFDLNESYIVPATIEQILVNSGDIVGKNLDARPQYKELYEAFNFNADGSVNGQAQTQQQSDRTARFYMSRYDDKQEEADQKAIRLYKTALSSVASLDDFLKTGNVYSLALRAVGIDPSEVSKFAIKKVLTSDLSDPKSYVNQLKDERFLVLAKAFNFTAKGGVTTPVLAQSSTAITQTARDYIVEKTRFLTKSEKEEARKQAEEESKYYTDRIARVETLSQFLADRKLVDIVLTANGFDPKAVNDEFLKKIFSSDLNDPKSFVNQQSDKRFAQMLGSFNFDGQGNISRDKATGAQNMGSVMATEQAYLNQVLETQQGEDNPGVRLALYFQRVAPTITDAYGILGDDALLEFFRVTFSLPSEFSSVNVDKQAKVVEKHINLKDLKDPAKLAKLVHRFTIMYDLEYGSSQPSAALLLGGGGGISADTLWALSQIRRG